MAFETAGALYNQVYPFVTTELERLVEIELLKPGTVPDKFLDSGTPGNETVNIQDLAARVSARIRDTFFGEPQMNIDIIRSNTAFWVQHLLKNPDRKLRAFDPHAEENKVVPVKPNAHIPIDNPMVDFLYLRADICDRIPYLDTHYGHEQLDVKLWKWYVENLSAIAKQFEYFSMQIQRGQSNIFVVTNHLTWANIPFLAFCFHHFLGIPKERLYAMVGPAIFTSEFEFEGARRWMNLILTWPDTEKGDTGYGRATEVQKSALRKTLKIMKNAQDGVSIIFLAPSGTSDKMNDGRCMMAYPSPGTMNLMGTIGSQYPIFPIGVNDSEIMGKDGLPVKGEVHLKMGYPNSSKVADGVVLTQLPKLVVDEDGREIGEWYYPKGTINPHLDFTHEVTPRNT
ncbi:hypothetical protein KBC86_02330 [Candidatus Gracilibacteria bacterium]|nr:hypothetical protein [Candidatus Gracilibacteria bacterium]